MSVKRHNKLFLLRVLLFPGFELDVDVPCGACAVSNYLGGQSI